MPKQGVQSFDRGLEILRLLATNKRMTATALSQAIGVHQTSATRMLQSLQKAGFVYKPDFHSFSPDLGIFALGSIAMQSFPIINISMELSMKLKAERNLEMSVGTLFDEKMFYFTTSETLRIFYDSDYPVHLSTIGLLLLHSLGKRTALRIIRGSIRKSNDKIHDAKAIYGMVDESLSKHGFLYTRDFATNKLNCSMKFQYERGDAAIAIFSKDKYLPPEECRTVLENALEHIGGKLAIRS